MASSFALLSHAVEINLHIDFVPIITHLSTSCSDVLDHGVRGVLRAFEAAAPVIPSKERNMYRIPGLCLGKVLLKKSQAKWTTQTVQGFL